MYFKDAFEPQLDQAVCSGDVYAAAPWDATVGFGDSGNDACDATLDPVVHSPVVYAVEPTAIYLSVLSDCDCAVTLSRTSEILLFC